MTDYTIDELAQATGLTVRTARYYASLGLLPPPQRRGRVAYYSAAHLARLELVRALQDHGFTLTAIEKHLANIPAEASAADLGLQRLTLTSWSPHKLVDLSRAQLEELAGRPLDDPTLEQMVLVGTLAQTSGGYQPLPGFGAHAKVLELDIPIDGIEAAGRAVARHTEALARELGEIFQKQVIKPYVEKEHTAEELEEFQHTVEQLRELTLEAIIGGFQRASNNAISRMVEHPSGQ